MEVIMMVNIKIVCLMGEGSLSGLMEFVISVDG